MNSLSSDIVSSEQLDKYTDTHFTRLLRTWLQQLANHTLCTFQANSQHHDILSQRCVYMMHAASVMLICKEICLKWLRIPCNLQSGCTTNHKKNRHIQK